MFSYVLNVLCLSGREYIWRKILFRFCRCRLVTEGLFYSKQCEGIDAVEVQRDNLQVIS